MGELSLHVIAAWLECFQEKPSWLSERTGLPGGKA